MIEQFKKVIQNFILPQFPWVMSFNIFGDDDMLYVVYYPEVNEDGDFTITEDYIELESLTLMMFKMLGGKSNEFAGVKFSTYSK